MIFSPITTKFAFIAGLAVGGVAAAATSYAGYRVGHWIGWDRGVAAADRQSEINDLNRELAAARNDLATIRWAADAAQANAAKERASLEAALKELADYEDELKKRPDADQCRLSDADVARLQHNHFRRKGAGPRRTDPAKR